MQAARPPARGARQRAFEPLERARKLLMDSVSSDDVGFWRVAAGIAHFASAQRADPRVHCESATRPWLLSLTGVALARISLAWTLM